MYLTSGLKAYNQSFMKSLGDLISCNILWVSCYWSKKEMKGASSFFSTTFLINNILGKEITCMQAPPFYICGWLLLQKWCQGTKYKVFLAEASSPTQKMMHLLYCSLNTSKSSHQNFCHSSR